MKQASLAVLVAMIVVAASGNAEAIVPGWTADHYPIRLGDMSTWTVEPQVPPMTLVQSYKWEVQGVTTSGGLGTWVDIGVNAMSLTRVMNRVGILNVRLTVKYQSTMGMPAPADTVVTYGLNVVPPNTDVVTSGLNTPTPLSPFGTTRIDVVFQMRDGSVPIGNHFDGYAQEYITSWTGYDPTQPPGQNWQPLSFVPHWDPASGTTSPYFVRTANWIIDRKFAACDPSWYATYTSGFTWMKVSQKNRLVTMNWVSQEVIIEFPMHDFEIKKSGTSDWTLHE